LICDVLCPSIVYLYLPDLRLGWVVGPGCLTLHGHPRFRVLLSLFSSFFLFNEGFHLICGRGSLPKPPIIHDQHVLSIHAHTHVHLTPNVRYLSRQPRITIKATTRPNPHRSMNMLYTVDIRIITPTILSYPPFNNTLSKSSLELLVLFCCLFCCCFCLWVRVPFFFFFFSFFFFKHKFLLLLPCPSLVFFSTRSVVGEFTINFRITISNLRRGV